MPFWPFRSDRRRHPPDPEAALQGSPLAEITDATPHRFRIRVSEADAPRATAALGEPGWLRREFSVAAVGDPDDREVSLDLASTFSPRTAAILRPLNVLDRAGVPVTGLEALDLVRELAEEALVAAVAGWGTNANRGPHRHRLEVLAGQPLLDRCGAHLEQADERGPNRRSAWQFATTCVAFNTAGAEGPMLDAALKAKAGDPSSFLDPVISRAQVARLTGSFVTVPEEALTTLIRRRGYVSERAAHLASYLPSPLAEPVSDALCDAGVRGGEGSEVPISALANAVPTQRVRDTLTRVLASDQPNPMAAALGSLAAHWPDEARPVWRRFLESRSVPLRWAAEQTLGLHGADEDVPEAAAHLAKLLRTKSSMHSTPPRGAELVGLLLRHPEHPDARAGLANLAARWDRLHDDMREWLEQHHPELRPDRPGGAAGPAEPEEEVEEQLVWPPPTIERESDALVLWFDEGAHHSRTRDRFEELAVAAPAIEVLDGDREWLRVRIDAADPDRVVRELWEEAGPA